MTRVEFLQQLAYLLQDMDEKDREDVLNYYRDYMDEAQIDNGDSVNDLFESPEKIAMSIRSSCFEDDSEQIQADEQGFKNVHVETEGRVPEVYGHPYEKEKDFQENTTSDDWYKETETYHRSVQEAPKVKQNNLGKILLIVALCVVALPLIASLGGGLVGVVLGIVGAVIGVVFGTAALAIGCIAGGVGIFVMSILRMAISVPQGVFMMGSSLLMVAVGILFVLLTIVIFKRFIPWIIRGIVTLFRKIFHRAGGERE